MPKSRQEEQYPAASASCDDDEDSPSAVHQHTTGGMSSEILPLPEPKKDISGTSRANHKNFTAHVSNQSGYLCRVHVEAQHDVPPQDIYDIFTYPDNSAIFRDVKRIDERQVLYDEAGKRKVKMTQVSEVKLMWMKHEIKTSMDVTEDHSDPDNLKIHFDMIRSDALSRFQGEWNIQPIRDQNGNVLGSSFVFEQDVLPKGVPPFLRRMPVLGGMLRGITLRTVTRLMEDLNSFLGKQVKKSGKPARQVLDEVCGSGTPGNGR
jgi:hypothetical protein